MRGALLRVPFATSYTGLLIATSLWLGTLGSPGTLATGAVLGTDRSGVDVVRAASTNLANLRAGHWSVLAASALVLENWATLRVAATAVALGTAEVLLGRLRTPAVFLAGHVGSSLVVAGLLEADVLPGVRAVDVASAVDVGPSYGALAVLGALAATRVRGLRWAGLVVVVLAGAVLAEPTFTAWGHLVAGVLGAGVGAVLTRVRPGGAAA